MEHPSTPAGGQPANLPAETSAKRSGVIRMSVHIPDNWNPHADLLAIADYARDLVNRAEAKRGLGVGMIEASQVREVNFMACLLAMRLSGCRITLPAAEAEQEGGAR